jgi:hypothetical protein
MRQALHRMSWKERARDPAWSGQILDILIECVVSQPVRGIMEAAGRRAGKGQLESNGHCVFK